MDRGCSNRCGIVGTQWGGSIANSFRRRVASGNASVVMILCCCWIFGVIQFSKCRDASMVRAAMPHLYSIAVCDYLCTPCSARQDLCVLVFRGGRTHPLPPPDTAQRVPGGGSVWLPSPPRGGVGGGISREHAYALTCPMTDLDRPEGASYCTRADTKNTEARKGEKSGTDGITLPHHPFSLICPPNFSVFSVSLWWGRPG